MLNLGKGRERICVWTVGFSPGNVCQDAIQWYEFWWLHYLLLIGVVFDFFLLVFLMNDDECELKMMKISKVEDEERKKN